MRVWRRAGQRIGCRTIRPYAMNAMRRPSTPLKIMGVISRYLTCTQTNTRLSTAKTVAARMVSGGCQWKASGTMSPTVHASSRMPRVIQASRGNAPKDGTSWLTLSNMKTFMTPDDPYRSAARTCRTHNRMFIVPLPGFRVGPRGAVSPRAIYLLSPDLGTMDNLMIITFHVTQRTLFETGARSMASWSCDKVCKQTDASEILLPLLRLTSTPGTQVNMYLSTGPLACLGAFFAFAPANLNFTDSPPGKQNSAAVRVFHRLLNEPSSATTKPTAATRAKPNEKYAPSANRWVMKSCDRPHLCVSCIVHPKQKTTELASATINT